MPFHAPAIVINNKSLSGLPKSGLYKLYMYTQVRTKIYFATLI